MGKRLQQRLLSDTLTAEWRSGEAHEGQGSETPEPRETRLLGSGCVMKVAPLGHVGEDITWPDQVAPPGRRAPSTRNVKPQTSNPTHHRRLQHLPPIPSATQPPPWIPEDTLYRDRDNQYHYPTPIEQLATTLGHPANTKLLQHLEDSVRTAL